MTPIERTVSAPESEGDRWLVAISRNAAGVPSSPLWVKVRVDATAPALQWIFEPALVESANKRWLPPGVEAAVVANDAISGVDTVWIEIDGGSRSESANTGEPPRQTRANDVRARVELPTSTGQVGLEAGAVDQVGNSSAVLSTEVWVDADAPTGELRIEGAQVRDADRLITAAEVFVRDDIDDSHSGLARVERTLDGVMAADPDSWGGALSAGVHRAEATATDRVGNQMSRHLSFEVDDRGPEISWQASARKSVERDGVTYFTSPVRVEASAEDDLAGTAEISWSSGAGWTPWTGPVDRVGESLELRARDRVGNESRLEATWRLDLEPPELFLVDDQGKRHPAGSTVEITRGESVSVDAVDDEAGVDQVLTSWRHVGWFRVASFSERQQISENGRYFVYARASDRLGNETQARWQVRARSGGAR